MPADAPRPVVGVTVLPEYIQNEGVDGVLDNLVHRARATAVTTSPYLMEPADERTGGREPPIDAGAGSVRLLDRPLWGQRELFVRTSPSFAPNKRLYAGLRYQPPEPDELTDRQGPVLHEFIRAAHARHLKVYLQVQAVIPPGYRVQFGGPDDSDKPQLPNGQVPAKRVSNNGSLASPDVTAYGHAMLADLCQQYREIDGIRVDWPEYPPYSLDDVFVDFSPHAQRAAAELGFDFDRMHRQVGALYEHLHGRLTDNDLVSWTDPDGGRYGLLRRLSQAPGVVDWLAFKAALVERLLAGFRQAMNSAGGERMELVAHAFPPPFTLASGIDLGRCAPHVAGYCVKLYTMHWPMMLRFYGDALLAANPGISSPRLAAALVRWFDLVDGPGLPRVEDYHYPEPNEPHPVDIAALARKLRQARQEAAGAPVYVLAHGYGKPQEFRQRLTAIRPASPDGIWVNRYGYLSDEKLSILGDVWQ